MSARVIGESDDGLREDRTRLAETLRDSGRAGAVVEAAFLAVPRHLFLPKVEAREAYRDAAITVKSDAEGRPVSSSTQPGMMAIMLEQLGLAAGQRVLEIGTGTGYNAAVLARLVGDSGSVVTIDVEADLVEQARANLAAAGVSGVTVVWGDGADGVPAYAPYDRIIVTAGAWDLASQWLAQLNADGRIVLPLSVRGTQLSVVFECTGSGIWVSRSAQRCRFIRMTGASSGPEAVLPLGPRPGLFALVTDGHAPEADALYEALSGPATEISTGLLVAGIAELSDLDLWLTVTEPGLTKISFMGRRERPADEAPQRFAGLARLGGYVRCGGSGEFGVAAVTSSPGATEHEGGSVTFTGYGAGGAALSGHLAARAAVWDGLGRPGADSLELSVYPAGTIPPSTDATIIQRPNTTLVATWNQIAS
jgi:protein-L-isoaspartate(D-aspartate) O-methyltransferase